MIAVRMRAFCAVVAAAGLAGCAAYAQDYPAKAVRVIVPFAPGGGSDIVARQVSHKPRGSTGR